MSKDREDADVPRPVRREVTERDGSCCRVCGRYVEYPALHHIDYRSQGGGHVPENLIVVGWLPGHDCHLPIVHADKRLWQPILEIVAITPGVTAFAMRRQLELGDPSYANGRSRPAPRAPRAVVPRTERSLAGWPTTEDAAHPLCK